MRIKRTLLDDVEEVYFSNPCTSACDCKYRKTETTVKLNNFLEQKRFELEIEDNAFNRGMVKGLEIALRILNE